jgi:hypothetical protein
MRPQTVDRLRLEREVSAARLRVLALVPFSPPWDAAMDMVEELERALWRLEPVPIPEDRFESATQGGSAVRA